MRRLRAWTVCSAIWAFLKIALFCELRVGSARNASAARFTARDKSSLSCLNSTICEGLSNIRGSVPPASAIPAAAAKQDDDDDDEKKGCRVHLQHSPIIPIITFRSPISCSEPRDGSPRLSVVLLVGTKQEAKRDDFSYIS